MKIIDLLVKIANNEEVPEKIIFDNQIWEKEKGSKNIFYVNDCNYDLFVCIFKSNLTYSLNDEIEIIEEETTYEQNFTGWQIVQNGKVVYSYGYDEPALKPVDIADVEKNIKEMLKEKPKKIEFLGKQDLYIDDVRGYSVNIEKIGDKVNELIREVNYLLEKESDK